MKFIYKTAFCIIFVRLILKVNVRCAQVTESSPSQIKHCRDCKWSDANGCKVCVHEGHESQYLIGLKRYNRDGNASMSAIEIAKDNHDLFKNGKISFVLRTEGPFGSLGFDDSRHGKDYSQFYNNEPRKSSKLRSTSSAFLGTGSPKEYIPLSQIKDSLYVGSMFVGTPPQLVHPIFDTGSTNVWVVGTNCSSQTCKKVKRFNPSLSRTFKALANPKKIHIKFGTGEIEGTPAKDFIKIGGMRFIQSFAVVDKEEDIGGTNNVFKKINFEGIVGLAFSEMSSIPGPSVLDNLLDFKLLKHNEFSFFLSRDSGDALLMFGGANPEFYEGDLKMFPVVREHYWEVALDGIYLGSDKICCDQKSYVIFDSGTSLNSVPSSEFSTFVNLVERKCHDQSQDLTITYVLGGEEIKLTPDEYIYNNEGSCTPAYMQLDVPSEFGHAYVLGSSAFMRFYFTLFRRGDDDSPSMVGVARSKSGPEVERIAKELAMKNYEL